VNHVPLPTRLTTEERERLRRAVDRERRVQLRIVGAEVWLRNQLLEGPRRVADLVGDGKRIGIGHRQLVKASARLRLLGRGSGTWRLPPDLPNSRGRGLG
jgi:hypothetical protein